MPVQDLAKWLDPNRNGVFRIQSLTNMPNDMTTQVVIPDDQVLFVSDTNQLLFGDGVSTITQLAQAITRGTDYFQGDYKTADGNYRDASKWPYSSLSVVNLPLATTAILEDPAAPATAAIRSATNGYGWINSGAYDFPINKASDADALSTFSDYVYSPRSIKCKAPDNVIIANGTDRSCCVVSPDGRLAHEFFGTSKVGANAYSVARHVTEDIYGMGEGPNGGIHASGNCTIGGIIRKWEVEAGQINHIMSMAIDQRKLKYTSGSSGYDRRGYSTALGYEWPATDQDYGSEGLYTGPIAMGSLFAIDPRYKVTDFPFGTELAKMIFKAYQTHGGYVQDMTSTSGTTSLALMEAGASAELGQARAEVRLYVQPLLQRVTNNTERTPGGGVLLADGSNRRRPLAPPLSPIPPVRN